MFRTMGVYWYSLETSSLHFMGGRNYDCGSLMCKSELGQLYSGFSFDPLSNLGQPSCFLGTPRSCLAMECQISKWKNSHRYVYLAFIIESET